MRFDKINRETWIAIGVGSALVLVGMSIYGLTRPPTPIPSVQPWNSNPIRALQGAPVTISVPRGESFLVASPDVLLQAQSQQGNESHLVVVPLLTGQPEYTIKTVIVERGSGKVYPVEFLAVPVESLAAGGALPP